MSRLVFRIVKLEERAKMGDIWGNHADAWVEIVRRYDAVHGREMVLGEVATAASVLTAEGSPPSLPELAASFVRLRR